MVITLIIVLVVLYSLYLIKELKKKTNTHLYNLDIELYKKSLYLLDELDNKIKTNKISLLNKIKEINNLNQKDNNIKHQQLISNEFKKLRSDINKDLDDIVESVKNIKVF